MSTWAENIAKNAAAARDACADKLGAISRLVSSSFDDLRHGSWHFYQNDHPYDRIETAMIWAEALVRRVILSLVVEMGGEITEQGGPGSRPGTRSNSAASPATEPGSPETPPTVITERGAAVLNPLYVSEAHESKKHPSGTQNDLTGARVTSAAMDCCTAHGMTSDDQPPRPYRPTFQWSELRPAPTIPTGKTISTPRPKPRKHDFKTKVEARLALFAHMLEHKEAYAKRLAFRLDVKSHQTRSTVIPERGKAAVSGTQNEENKGWVSETTALSTTHREATDLIRGEAGGQTKDQLPKLLWSLYTTDPPPIDALKDDLVALHMAYEQPSASLMLDATSFVQYGKAMTKGRR